MYSPLRREEPRWVCITCYLGVYCACAGDAEWFAGNPDRIVVERIARYEDLSVDDVRRIAWEHQLAIIQEERKAGRGNGALDEFEAFLQKLLSM